MAKDRSQCAGQCLHLRPEADAKTGGAGAIDPQMNADGVGAFGILAHVFDVKCLALDRRPVFRAICIMDEQRATFAFGQPFEERNDLLQPRRHLEMTITCRNLQPTSEDRGQRTWDRGQKSEVRGQRSSNKVAAEPCNVGRRSVGGSAELCLPNVARDRHRPERPG
jgi:hypothetical protein